MADERTAKAKAAAKAKAEVVVPDWVKTQKHRIQNGLCQVGLDITVKALNKTVCLWVGIGVVGNYLQVDGVEYSKWEAYNTSPTMEHPIVPAYYDRTAVFMPACGSHHEYFSGYHVFFFGKGCIMIVTPPKIDTLEHLCRVKDEIQSVLNEDYYGK